MRRLIREATVERKDNKTYYARERSTCSSLQEYVST